MVKLAETQQVDVVPNPLELHGDSVKVDMSVVLPAKMLPQKYVYNLTTYYKSGESDVEVGKMTFDAADFPDSKTTTSRKSDSYSFLYDPATSQGVLEVQGVAVDQKGKTKEAPRAEVAKGIITTSTLVEDELYPAYAFHGYNDKEELEPTNVDFFFDQGSSLLKSSETRSQKGKDFAAFIADKNVTRTVTITGTHSPEGTETVNSDLSEDRAKSIEKYYRSQMRRYDYKDLADSINFILKPVVEDWTAFKDALSAYEGVSDTQKSEILKVVNGTGVFADKEKALQNLDSYKAIFKDIYPGLRAAKTEVLTVKVKKSNAEIAILAKQVAEGTASADTLSTPELMFAAMQTPSLTEREAIFLAVTKKDGSWQAHNNLGALYLEMAIAAEGDEKTSKIEMAITQLEIAANKKDAAEVQANMATAYTLQGDKAQAYDAIVAGLAKSPSADHAAGMNAVKGSLEIKRGEYDEAFETLKTANESTSVAFNRGLALLLNKDYENAVTGFGNATEQDAEFAKAYYASAIASARLRNDADMLASLKSAIEIDPELKEKALNDLEFANYATQVAEALN
ncbi:OmpA family protein [Reichenbachiella carrageenanivorans]|uniref:OmpA family protein n=1 Tax=Reichenbachiella carrageenanivorans TaxID=2979869 RepID=A0ABY6CXD6_9BACT|nr:OmpA family protein [Reichenbachiella carrageenanivorans]UXX78045.1 OmpA family protein [Reichenbachiella carrageenanivorans]